MTLERWEQVKELLHAALKRSPAERAAFLTEACGEDVALRREMESLLAWAEKGEGLEQSSPEKPLHSMAHRGTATVTKPPGAGELKGRGTPSGVSLETVLFGPTRLDIQKLLDTDAKWFLPVRSMVRAGFLEAVSRAIGGASPC